MPPAHTLRRTGTWDALAIAALALAALAATFTYEQDFDAFWHLASGNWMLQHQRVLDFDPFSCQSEDPGAPWVDVYWLFQLAVAVTHAIGGFPAITVAQCLLTGAAFLLLALSLRGRVPTAWLVLGGLVMLPVFASRIRIRPEMFTLPFLLAAVVLVEGVRRGGPARKLWWLVPIMLTWVNMHGLYFLGLVVMWGAMIGAVIDRRLGRSSLAGNLPTQAALAPMLTATTACLVSPWPLEAALHPLMLWSRISGQTFYYTYGVSEFRPTWQTIWAQHDMLLLVGLLAVVLLVNARRVPLAHLAWLMPFLALGMMAVRNVALLAPVCGLLLAWHGGSVLRRWGEARPPLARAARPATVLLTLAALAASAGYATEYTYRLTHQGVRTGAGLCPDHYMTGLAKYLGESNVPGNVFTVDFGDASTFIYYSYPARQVWMDGRLEIRSLQRFQQYQEIAKELGTRAGADRVALPETVRFVAAARDDQGRLAALAQSDRFRLIRLDRTGACFARLDWHDARPPQQIAEELPPRPNLEDFDRPLGEDGLVEGFGSDPRRWYRQNPDSAIFHFASMMLSLGQTPLEPRPAAASPLQLRCSRLALRYFQAAVAEGTVSPALAGGSLGQALQQWAQQTGQTASAAAPIDVDLARAIGLYSRMDLGSLPENRRWTYGMAHVQCLLQGRHTEAASEVAEAFVKVLPPMQQMFPPAEYITMRDALRTRLEEVRAELVGLRLRSLAPLERARELARPERGLTLEAIRELRAAANLDAEGRLALADLLLRLGRPAEAREACRSAAAKGAEEAAVALREALCEWVQSGPRAALDLLEGPPPASTSPRRAVEAVGLYYKALALEELGLYARAREALRAAAATPDVELAKLIDRSRSRL